MEMLMTLAGILFGLIVAVVLNQPVLRPQEIFVLLVLEMVLVTWVVGWCAYNQGKLDGQKGNKQ